MPTTPSMLRTISSDPAMYMSSANSALIMSGPTVDRLSTQATMAPPETSCGNSPPMPETNGLSARRTGYFISSLPGRTPLAIAVIT